MKAQRLVKPTWNGRYADTRMTAPFSDAGTASCAREDAPVHLPFAPVVFAPCRSAARSVAHQRRLAEQAFDEIHRKHGGGIA